MQDMIFNTLREIDADNEVRGLPPHLEGADNYQAALYLSHIMYEAVSTVVSAAKPAMPAIKVSNLKSRVLFGEDDAKLLGKPNEEAMPDTLGQGRPRPDPSPEVGRT